MNDLVNQLNNYIYLDKCVNNMISNLNSAISELEDAKNKIGEAYSVDDESADANKISECYNRLVSQKSYLESTCKNAISNAEDYLTRSIRELEAEQEQG
jgi:hypothetical protein